MRKRPAATATPLEAFEIRPLLHLGKAAMSSPDRSPDPLTHEGMVMLLDIIDDLLFPKELKPDNGTDTPSESK